MKFWTGSRIGGAILGAVSLATYVWVAPEAGLLVAVVGAAEMVARSVEDLQEAVTKKKGRKS